ncbi:MAG: type 1 glutamine amidotransferase [Deltaproteobacteria bacterium]|nr:type 1 glutamine amidotransferase [Deltaproteobacteria bacterium]MCL5879222.1 type 1 glutamine amidotransferase [Deltaproteobacteria bacterium]MDA8304995.1 type 1 glutamine amidotransferase [Deltaproteobacteria bacterium]
MTRTLKALIVSADDFEDTELLVPYYRLKEEGVHTDIASMKKGRLKGKHGYEVEANKTLGEINPDDYDMLILPGGKAPETVRKDKDAVRIAKSFFEKKKPVSAICHGPQTLVTAGLLKGRHATSYKTVASELKEAGALYEDKDVVVDGNLVTSRQPSDLPVFLQETIKKLNEIKK